MFEIAEVRRMKGDDNRHSFAERKPLLSLAAMAAAILSDLFLSPNGFKLPAKVVHIAEHFRKIHRYPLHFGFLA